MIDIIFMFFCGFALGFICIFKVIAVFLRRKANRGLPVFVNRVAYYLVKK